VNLQLNNKNVLITGASKGLGAEVVRGFVAEGAHVAMCARSIDSLERLRAEFRGAPFSPLTVSVDATDEKEVARAVISADQEMGGIDVLVNNVGGAIKFADLFTLETEDWINAFKLNIMSMVNFTRATYPILKKSKSPRIVNVSSLTGLQPGVFNPHYSACKAAAINFSKHCANLFAKDSILVNCIVPGTFESDAWDKNSIRVAEEKKISFAAALEIETEIAGKTIPLNRIGRPQDIVPLVLMLASPLTSWQTGSCTVIDGGKNRGIH
jgi:3-oxoacyl-[acyl-carrier protein] reductase